MIDRYKIKEKVFSNRGFKTIKTTLKFFITPLAFLGAIFGIRFYKFIHKWLRPQRISIKRTPEDFGLRYEEVTFLAETPLALCGWFIPASKKSMRGASPTIILCHGWPTNREEVLNRAEFLVPDYNVFLFDFRALGESPGAYSSFGFYEQNDLVAALRYLEGRPEVDKAKIGLFGFSMGASVAIMVGVKFPEVRAIVAESPYASLDRIIKHVFRKKDFLQRMMVNLAVIVGWFFARVDPRKVSPLEVVENLNIPLFIIHSRDDTNIPFENSKLIFEAASEPKSIWAPTGSRHGEIINDYPGEYKKAVKGFFDKYLR